MPVAEDAGQGAGADDRVDQLRRERLLECGEVAPWERDRAAGDLPMPRRRVLALAALDAVAVPALGPCRLCASRQRVSRGGLTGMGEPEPHEIRQGQRAAAQPGAVAPTLRTGQGDMAERIGAGIAVEMRVLGAAAADRIEHDQDRPGHVSPAPRRSTPVRGSARRRAAPAYRPRGAARRSSRPDPPRPPGRSASPPRDGPSP